MPEVLLSARNVSKRFCRNLKKSLWYGVKDIFADLNPGRNVSKEISFQGVASLNGRGSEHNAESRSAPDDSLLRSDEFWATKNVSFELRRGECLGLLGRNGAGKTTLLRMLNGLIKPDQGSITLRGRVGALIALGAGFNPLLTGRENIYVNGSILGLTKREIEEKLESIIAFADIGEFIDAPVQSYSSGMNVRLGFAVASALQPDILLVDEVLAVGDTAFKVRCYNRIREILPHTAVILVSHNMFDIARVCSRVIVMKKGQVGFIGDVQNGMHCYNALNQDGSEKANRELSIHREKGIGEVEVRHFSHFTNGLDTELELHLSVQSSLDGGKVRFRILFFDASDSAVAEWDSTHHEQAFTLVQGHNQYNLKLERIRLKSDEYKIVVILTDLANHGYWVNIEGGLRMQIQCPCLAGAPYKI